MMKFQLCMLSRFSHVQLFAALQTVARQAPLSMGFSRQEYWSGLPFPSPGDLLNPDRTLVSYVSYIGRQVLYTSTTWEAPVNTMWKRKTVRHEIYFKESLSLRFFNWSFCSPEYDFDINYNSLLEPWNIPDDVLWKNREA